MNDKQNMSTTNVLMHRIFKKIKIFVSTAFCLHSTVIIFIQKSL